MVLTRSKTKTLVTDQQLTSLINQPVHKKKHRPTSYQRKKQDLSTTSIQHLQRWNQLKMPEIKEAFQEIDKFHGSENENVEKWLQKVDGICECFDNISDADKLKRIPTKLGHEVFDWFNENKHEVGNWTTFKQKIMEKYPVITTEIHPLVNVDNFNKRWKQDDETVAQYYQAKMELANKIDPKMIDALRVAALIDGLPTSLRVQLAYKKSEISTPSKFLIVVQALEQEMELLSRESLEEQMSRLSLKKQYPTENQHMEQLITTIRRPAQNYNNHYAYSTPSEMTKQHNEQIPLYQRTYKQSAIGSQSNKEAQYQLSKDTSNYHTNINSFQSNKATNNYDQQQHDRANEHYEPQSNRWTNGNTNSGRCYNCGKFGHYARYCQDLHLKE